MIDVGKFKEARLAAGLSQTALARLAGTSQQLIGEIEAGRARTTKSIYRIAEALKIQAHELDDEIPAPSQGWDEAMNDLRELDREDQEYALRTLREFIAMTRKRARRFEAS